MFRIVCDPSIQPAVCVCTVRRRTTGSSQPVVPCTHTTGSKLRCQTPIGHTTNICEPLRVISVMYSSILYYPKHVGVIFNFVSFKLLYNVDFNL